MKKIWLLFLAAAVAMNAVVALRYLPWFSQLTQRTGTFNRSTVVRIDTEQCRRMEQGKVLYGQCLFEFERRWTSEPLRFSRDTKVEYGDLGIPMIRGDGAVTDEYNTVTVQNGIIFVNRQPIEVKDTPQFFLIRRDGTPYGDSFNAL